MPDINNNKQESETTNNATNHKNNNEKKEHQTRNMFIILVLFSAICVGVTAFFIIKRNGNKSKDETSNNVNLAQSETKDIEQKVDDGLGIKSLDETYKGNDLEIKSTEFVDGKLKSQEYNIYQIHGTYIQINGLKDKDIQNKINEEIMDTINSIRSEYASDLDSLNEVEISSVCTANFSDVLSIRINVHAMYNSDKYKYDGLGLNYDLSTGNKISFEDLFTSNAAIKSILSKSAYDSYAIQIAGGDNPIIDDNPKFYGDKNYNANRYYDIVESTAYSDVEDKVFKLMTSYNNGDELNFSFSPRTIKVYKNEDTITIPIINYYNQIAIYKRYKSRSNLYDGTYSAYIVNDTIPVRLPTNNSGVALDINEGGGPSGIKYMAFKKSSNLFIYVSAYSIYSEDAHGMVFDKQAVKICMQKANEVMKEYTDNGKQRAINISIYPDYYYYNGIHEGDYYVSVTEYVDEGSSNSKFIAEVIKNFQKGYEQIISNSFGTENNTISQTSYTWVYYKDTNSWKKFSEADEYSNFEDNQNQDNIDDSETIWPEYEGAQ